MKKMLPWALGITAIWWLYRQSNKDDAKASEPKEVGSPTYVAPTQVLSSQNTSQTNKDDAKASEPKEVALHEYKLGNDHVTRSNGTWV